MVQAGRHLDSVATSGAQPTAFAAEESFSAGPIVGGSGDAWATNVIFSRAALRWQGAVGVFLDVQNSTFWSARRGYGAAAQGVIPAARAASADSVTITHNTSPYVDEFQRASRGLPLPPPVPVTPPPPVVTSGSVAGPLAGGLAALAVVCAPHVSMPTCGTLRRERGRWLQHSAATSALYMTT